MRKLDVKEIHGYETARGLKLLKPDAVAAQDEALSREEHGHASLLPLPRHQPLHPAVPHGRDCGLARAANDRRLRPRHGRRGDHRRLRALGLGLGLRREARAQQLHRACSSTTSSCTASACASGRPSSTASAATASSSPSSPFVSCVIGLDARRARREVSSTCPPGAAGGMLAGSQTMSAAIGSAEQAVLAGAVTLPPGTTPEQVSAMIALSYGITYIWGTVGIILISKYLPKWWGVDAKAAARDYEKEHGVASGDMPALSGWTAGGLRAYRLENDAWVGKTRCTISCSEHPEYRVRQSGAGRHGARRRRRTTPLKQGDVDRARRQARGHDREDGPDRPRGLRPRRARRAARPAEILVTNSELLKKTREEWRALPGADQIQVVGARALRRADPDRHRHQAAAHGHRHRRRAEGRRLRDWRRLRARSSGPRPRPTC